MGISLFLTQIPAAQVPSYLEDPSLLDAQLHLPFRDHINYWKNPDRDHSLTHDMDKSWHPLYYLLTNGETTDQEPTVVTPAHFLLFGGSPTTSSILDYYGPGHILSSDEIVTWVSYLRDIDETTLKANFDPKQMGEKAVDHEEFLQSGEAWTYYWGHFVELKAFLERTGGEGR